MLEGKRIVWPLGIENGHGGWHHFVGNMMVTDDKIYAKTFGIGYFLDGLDATIENDNEFDTCLMSEFYPLLAYSISFHVAVGNIVIYVGIELLQKLVHQCYRRATVYVIVAINQDAFFSAHGII